MLALGLALASCHSFCDSNLTQIRTLTNATAPGNLCKRKGPAEAGPSGEAQVGLEPTCTELQHRRRDLSAHCAMRGWPYGPAPHLYSNMWVTASHRVCLLVFHQI